MSALRNPLYNLQKAKNIQNRFHEGDRIPKRKNGVQGKTTRIIYNSKQQGDIVMIKSNYAEYIKGNEVLLDDYH